MSEDETYNKPDYMRGPRRAPNALIDDKQLKAVDVCFWMYRNAHKGTFRLIVRDLQLRFLVGRGTIYDSFHRMNDLGIYERVWVPYSGRPVNDRVVMDNVPEGRGGYLIFGRRDFEPLFGLRADVVGIYLYIRSYSPESGVTTLDIALRFGLRETTVKRKLKKLGDAGLIEIAKEQRKPNGRYAHDVCTYIELDTSSALIEDKASTVDAASQAVPGATPEATGGTSRVAASDTKPSPDHVMPLESHTNGMSSDNDVTAITVSAVSQHPGLPDTAKPKVDDAGADDQTIAEPLSAEGTPDEDIAHSSASSAPEFAQNMQEQTAYSARRNTCAPENGQSQHIAPRHAAESEQSPHESFPTESQPHDNSEPPYRNSTDRNFLETETTATRKVRDRETRSPAAGGGAASAPPYGFPCLWPDHAFDDDCLREEALEPDDDAFELSYEVLSGVDLREQLTSAVEGNYGLALRNSDADDDFRRLAVVLAAAVDCTFLDAVGWMVGFLRRTIGGRDGWLNCPSYIGYSVYAMVRDGIDFSSNLDVLRGSDRKAALNEHLFEPPLSAGYFTLIAEMPDVEHNLPAFLRVARQPHHDGALSSWDDVRRLIADAKDMNFWGVV